MGEGASTPVLPRPGGVIVLQRISPPPSEDVPDAVFEEGPESDDADYDDEEDGTRNIWLVRRTDQAVRLTSRRIVQYSHVTGHET